MFINYLYFIRYVLFYEILKKDFFTIKNENIA